MMEPYQELEQKYANFCGADYGVSCNSGTAALHLALLGLGVVAGDEVVLPDFAMSACAFAVSYCGATPVFADVSLDDYGLDPVDFERKITSKTKAVMVVHTYGRIAQIKKIIKIAHAKGIAVIEDACEAQGAIKHSKADVTCWSFFKNKIIAAEEGGMLTTNRKDIADRANYLKNMAFSKAHDYYHTEIGYNYRMPNSQARLALASLHLYPRNAARRRKIEVWYRKYDPNALDRRQAVWFYETAVQDKVKVLAHPFARDSFKPLSTYPMYGSNKGRPNALALSRMLVLLPVRTDMTEADVKALCTLL